MLTESQVKVLIDAILNDERFWYAPAQVDTNVVLALIQTGMEAEFRAYCRVLNLTPAIIKKQWQKDHAKRS